MTKDIPFVSTKEAGSISGRRFPERPFIEAAAFEVSAGKLRDLADQVRATLPLPTAITRLQLNQEAGAVVCTWCAHQFVVTPMLQVFELKGTKLYLTEISILIQALLERQFLQKQPISNS